jgi:hypothetical protein
MLTHNRSLIGPNRKTQAIFVDGRVCVDCARWKPWGAYYHDNARTGGSGHMAAARNAIRAIAAAAESTACSVPTSAKESTSDGHSLATTGGPQGPTRIGKFCRPDFKLRHYREANRLTPARASGQR